MIHQDPAQLSNAQRRYLANVTRRDFVAIVVEKVGTYELLDCYVHHAIKRAFEMGLEIEVIFPAVNTNQQP